MENQETIKKEGQRESAKWGVKFKVEKYHEDSTPFKGNEDEFIRRFKPFEVIEGKGNCLLNNGINLLWQLITGASAYHFSNTGALLGVGTSSTAANPSQTGLLAGAGWNPIDGGYPTISGTSVIYRSTCGPYVFNIAWNEWSIGNSGSGMTLYGMNRKVASLGTKAEGDTWIFTATITLA